MGFKKRKNRISLSTKFNLLTISLILATSLGITLFVIRGEIRKTYQELLNRGQIIADMVSQNSEYGVYTEDRESLSRLIMSLEVDPNIAYIIILNQKGDRLVHKFFKSSILLPPNLSHKKSESPNRFFHNEFVNQQDGRSYIDIQTPVISYKSDGASGIFLNEKMTSEQEVIGYIQIGLSQESFRKYINQFLLSTSLFTSFIAFIGIGLTLLITKRITSPIKKLRSATQEISGGDFHQHIEIDTNDEISDLSLSFNHMLERLKVYRGQTEAQTADLSTMNQRLLQEITERKRTEEALRESEEKYRTILENIEEGYYEVDLAGNFTFCNDSLCRMTGYPKDELIGMNNRQYTDQEDSKKLYQAFNEVYRTGKPSKAFDWEIIRKDGEKRVGEVSISLLKDAEGKWTGFRGIARDVTERKRVEESLRKDHDKLERRVQERTEDLSKINEALRAEIIERKQAEEALRESEKKYRSVIENIQDVFYRSDVTGSLLMASPSGTKMFGYDTVDEMIGLPLDSFWPDPKERERLLAQVRTIGSVKDFEAVLKRKDGTPFNASFTIHFYYDDNGNFLGTEGIIRDITERKRAEEEKSALQEQLRQSQKMEAIGQLAGGVAHDFNNLLTVITGYSDLILNQLHQSDSLRRDVEEIKRSAEKAVSLTRQLLAFSRKQVLRPKVLDLNHLVANMDMMLRRLIGEDIELLTVLNKELRKIKADPGQIEQVILNLAVNARDAMPKGGKLTVETANVELDENYVRSHLGSKAGHYAMLSMSDTGTGMPPEIRERIFEPFFTTKEKSKGTGLGLSTVYGIVKQSEGYIWVYSEPGRGTTFKIYFPMVEEAVESLEPMMDSTKPIQGNETILLVEDEEMVRGLIRMILERNGYSLLEASNGEEALRIAQEHSSRWIHLMVTDVVMPGMSGRELADCMQSLRPEMKVLYISGYTDDTIVHHGVSEKGMAFLQKPFSSIVLMRKVREVLDGHP